MDSDEPLQLNEPLYLRTLEVRTAVPVVDETIMKKSSKGIIAAVVVGASFATGMFADTLVSTDVQPSISAASSISGSRPFIAPPIIIRFPPKPNDKA